MGGLVDQGLLRSLLERLEAHWRTASVPWIDHLAPGLTEDEIADRASAGGIDVPAEAMVWWGWHAGVPHDAPGWPTLAPSTYPFSDIETCIDTTIFERKDPLFEERPLSNLLTLARNDDGLLMIHTDVADAEVSRVRQIDWEGDDDYTIAGSLTELVTTWVEVLDDRLCWWDESGTLQHDSTGLAARGYRYHGALGTRRYDPLH